MGQQLEDVRDILYLRCTVPATAISCEPRILLLADAADVGIILGAYVGFEMPNDVWTCDLLFGKGLLSHENWTIPQKELHALSALSNIKIILEKSLSDWGCKFFAFSDSEIALCWSIYEKTKLMTFHRNRVINIRSRMGLDILHHVDGKENPTDVGTRPELITADSVRPGSIWMVGTDWMKFSISKAQELNIIKTVEDIKLTNDKKKILKEGIAYDSLILDDLTEGIFAVVKVNTKDKDEIRKRKEFSSYLYPPLARGFTSVVRITALVLLAVRKFKKYAIKARIKKRELSEDALKTLDFPPVRFKVFHNQIVRAELGDVVTEPQSSQL